MKEPEDSIHGVLFDVEAGVLTPDEALKEIMSYFPLQGIYVGTTDSESKTVTIKL